MRLKTKPVEVADHAECETVFSFTDSRIRDKVIALLVDTRHDFRLQGARVVKVTTEPNYVPVLIAQISSALSRPELKKTSLVAARHVESDTGCQLIQQVTLDHVIRSPDQFKSLLNSPSWDLQPKSAAACGR